ncbi:transcriptional regulator MntR [Planococcus sp. FY231025]|uniref:transcriptional regulator MntR n=1 Tax=Planococcus sp. FY231025 TaxID=3455699 RepID=UPI003F910F20
MGVPTISMEDYLAKIYQLTEENGYARAADAAAALGILPSSVSKMLKKMAEQGLVSYEKYRGFKLTPEGSSIAKDIVDKHRTLEGFYRVLEIPATDSRKEIEGIEHHIGPEAVFCMGRLVRFLEENPSVKKAYMEYREAQSR